MGSYRRPPSLLGNTSPIRGTSPSPSCSITVSPPHPSPPRAASPPPASAVDDGVESDDDPETFLFEFVIFLLCSSSCCDSSFLSSLSLSFSPTHDYEQDDKMKAQVISEICETENSYLEDLRTLDSVFKAPLAAFNLLSPTEFSGFSLYLYLLLFFLSLFSNGLILECPLIFLIKSNFFEYFCDYWNS